MTADERMDALIASLQKREEALVTGNGAPNGNGHVVALVPPVQPIRLVHTSLDAFLAQEAAEASRLSTYLYEGCLTMFNGEPGGTKTWLLLHEGLTAARAGGNVLYIALEGHKRKLQERLRRLTLEDGGELWERFHVSFLPGVSDDEGGVAFKLSDPLWVNILIAELSRPEWRPSVLLIDPLADAVDGDADKEVEMKPAKAGLKRLRSELNLCVGLGHHTVKTAWTDSEGQRDVGPSKAHARGTGAWLGSTEIALDVTPTENQTNTYGEAEVVATKAKDFPEVPDSLVFTVTDTAAADGRPAVVTALGTRDAVRATATHMAKYRERAIAALHGAPEGCLTKAELLKHLKLPGKTGGEVLRGLSSHLGCLRCVTGKESQALGFHANAKVYALKSVSEFRDNSETSETESEKGVCRLGIPFRGSDTHTPTAGPVGEGQFRDGAK